MKDAKLRDELREKKKARHLEERRAIAEAKLAAEREAIRVAEAAKFKPIKVLVRKDNYAYLQA